MVTPAHGDRRRRGQAHGAHLQGISDLLHMPADAMSGGSRLVQGQMFSSCTALQGSRHPYYRPLVNTLCQQSLQLSRQEHRQTAARFVSSKHRQMGHPIWVLRASKSDTILFSTCVGMRAPLSHRQGYTDACERTEGVSSWASASAWEAVSEPSAPL